MRKNITIVALGLAAALVLAAAPALAKGGPHADPTGNSITLNQSDPHLGGSVTFTVAYPTKVEPGEPPGSTSSPSRTGWGEQASPGDDAALGPRRRAVL